MMRQALGRQTTVGTRASITGVGVHSGKPATLTLSPAPAGTGIVFLRTDLDPEAEIAARHDRVVATELCTVIGARGASVSTIEHVMAALTAAGVDNAIVEVDGPEVPIVDGCSEAFLDLIDEAGIVPLRAARRAVRILHPVRVESGDAFVEFLPFAGTRYEVTIDFASAVIGRQSYVLDLTAANFRREIARARTFGFMADVERLWAMGFALGSSLDNSVALGPAGVMNPEGLRWADEFVRHKTLDAVGDLALLGLPFVGHFRSHKGGHRMNAALVKALLADPSAWRLVEDGVGSRTEPLPQTASALLAVAEE